MQQQNFKAQAREASFNWRNHVPVYGWTAINYPTAIQKPLREKYQEDEEKMKEQQKNREEKRKLEVESELKLEDEKKQNMKAQNSKNKIRKRIYCKRIKRSRN